MNAPPKNCTCIWSSTGIGGAVYISDDGCPAKPHDRTYRVDTEDDMEDDMEDAIENFINERSGDQPEQGMSFCDDHWARLRAKVEEAGLWDFVADGGEEATRRQLTAMDEGEWTTDTFEPLLIAHTMIVVNTLQLIGPWSGCPLCTLNEQHDLHCDGTDCELEQNAAAFDFWLDKAVGGVTELAEELELA